MSSFFAGAAVERSGGASKRDVSWVGAYVTVEAKQPKMFASP